MGEMLIAFAISLPMNSLFRAIGLRFGFVDKPRGALKPHERPIPYLGGTAILLSVFPWFLNYPHFFLPFVIMWAVGFLDDVCGLSPRIRLVIELLVGFATAYIIYGYSFTDSTILAFVFGAAVNAYNMVDGLDGICAGNVIVFAIFASLAGFVPSFSLVIAGAFAGYLVLNYPPAKIFMGDQGSYLAGTFIGLLLIQSWDSQNFVRVVALSWPVILDLFIGLIRRSLAGRSPFKGDRDHYYDKIFRLTGKKKGTTLLISVCIALFYASAGLLIPIKAIPAVLLVSSIVQVTLLKSLRST